MTEAIATESALRSAIGRFGRYFLSQMRSDSGELAVGGKEDEEETPAVDLEAPEVKAAISAKVEEIVGARVATQKSKTDAAESRAADAESKLSTAEETIATLTSEKETLQSTLDSKDYDVLVYELAFEEGVTPDLVKSLKGSTKEELKQAIKTVNGTAKGGVNRIFERKDTKLSSVSDEKLSEIIQANAKRARR